MFGGDAGGAGLGKDLADVLEETEIEVLTVCFEQGHWGMRLCPVGGQVVEGGQGALGPVAAGDLRDGEEGTPVVGQAVEDAWRQSRVASDKGGVIVFGPAGELASQNGFDFDVERVEAGQELALRGKSCSTLNPIFDERGQGKLIFDHGSRFSFTQRGVDGGN